MTPLFIAYFTIDTPYAAEAELLRASLGRLYLAHEIHGVPNLGNWQRNTQYKAAFVRRMIYAHLGRPLIYIDVDALVLREPVLFNTLDCDLAAVRFVGGELLSGTLYFGVTPTAIDLVDRWIALCAQYPDTFPAGLLPNYPNGDVAWDQRMLDLAMIQTPGVRFTELPPEYTYMDGLSTDHYPGLDPVIRHTRGSMRLRHLIDQ